MNKQSSTSFFHSEGLIDPCPTYQANRVASILQTFLDETDFVPSRINPVNKPLEDYMESLMYSRGIECKQLKRTIHLSAALIELGYPHCTLDEKKNIALYNWFAIYIDDRVTKDPLPFREFGSRLVRRQPQLDNVLTQFTEVLDRMWDMYDPLAASAIFNHTMQFVTGCCIEPELEKTPLKAGIERFPWYIRDLTGVSVAFSLFGFVKRENFDMMRIIQAIPDMNFWVALTNDLLSFHKEELANETGTYIYNRAKNNNQSRYETCSEIIAELKEARQNIHAVLADIPSALEVWKSWETGYIEWHLMQDRYHLKDLGILL